MRRHQSNSGRLQSRFDHYREWVIFLKDCFMMISLSGPASVIRWLLQMVRCEFGARQSATITFAWLLYRVMQRTSIMTSSFGNISSVTGPLWGGSTGHRWIPLTKANDAELFSLICGWTNGWAKNRDAGALRRHRTHYDVTVMFSPVRN